LVPTTFIMEGLWGTVIARRRRRSTHNSQMMI
jgi:hypothetical protein